MRMFGVQRCRRGFKPHFMSVVIITVSVKWLLIMLLAKHDFIILTAGTWFGAKGLCLSLIQVAIVFRGSVAP